MNTVICIYLSHSRCSPADPVCLQCCISKKKKKKEKENSPKACFVLLCRHCSEDLRQKQCLTRAQKLWHSSRKNNNRKCSGTLAFKNTLLWQVLLKVTETWEFIKRRDTIFIKILYTALYVETIVICNLQCRVTELVLFFSMHDSVQQQNVKHCISASSYLLSK